MASLNVVQISDRYQPYVLELGDEIEGSAFAVALVVLKRETGVLLAVPQDFFAEEVLAASQDAGSEDMIGPSILVKVPVARLAGHGIGPPTGQVEAEVDMVLVDATSDILAQLSPVDPTSPQWDLMHFFHSDPELYPKMDPLVSAAWDWILSPAAGERAQYYSAEEEVPECPVDDVEPEEGAAAAPAIANGPGSSLPGGRKPSAKGTLPKTKKPTVASLATSLEDLTQTIPVLMAEIATLSTRTKAMEESFQTGHRVSALTQPLGGSTSTGSARPSAQVLDLLKKMPPPRTSRPKTTSVAAPPTFMNAATGLMEERKETEVTEEPSDLTKAVLAQSSALTALVGHLAGVGGDGLADLQSGPAVLTSRGAAGRQKLQQELALQKGLFFASVYQQMARRMSPAMSSTASPLELMERGVTATRYVERYGGFGKCRDMGQIMWQLCIILDHMQAQNWEAAKDGAALLAVCLEQTALDNGQMEVGLLLALVEDPPAALFSNKALSPLSKGRAFAPMAEQRWITTALSYIKELDVISSRRADVAGTSSRGQGGGGATADAATPKPKVKRKPKPGWRKTGQDAEEA